MTGSQVRVLFAAPSFSTPVIRKRHSHNAALTPNWLAVSAGLVMNQPQRQTLHPRRRAKIPTVGRSLTDVQVLADHSNLRNTQKYIQENPWAHARIVELV
jgi:hypothetical protein